MRVLGAEVCLPVADKYIFFFAMVYLQADLSSPLLDG